jgi:dTDP-3-amino-3,4,6-trideoxy-alpha-D-glucose transaminase
LPVVPAQPIPLADTKAQYEPLLPELRRAIDKVLESSRFVLGPNVAAFEREAAAYLGVRETVGVANGTDAIVIALDALGVGPGDEVICPAFTFYATAEAIARTGATPVFAEIDAQTHVLDPEDVAARVNPRTKAILPVHLFGRPAPLADLAELDIPIVEDAAQAFGSPEIAGVGIATTFSFYPSKNLFALGDGGMIACRDAELFEYVGYNSRLDELQAAVLRIFLRHLDGWTRLRRDAAERYRELGIGDLVDAPPDEAGHVYHLFVCRSPDRDRIARALAEEGIGHKLWYDPPLHLQPALSSLGYEPGSLPVTERLARENIALPLWPGITAEQQERVVAVVRQAARVQATT